MYNPLYNPLSREEGDNYQPTVPQATAGPIREESADDAMGVYTADGVCAITGNAMHKKPQDHMMKHAESAGRIHKSASLPYGVKPTELLLMRDKDEADLHLTRPQKETISKKQSISPPPLGLQPSSSLIPDVPEGANDIIYNPLSEEEGNSYQPTETEIPEAAVPDGEDDIVYNPLFFEEKVNFYQPTAASDMNTDGDNAAPTAGIDTKPQDLDPAEATLPSLPSSPPPPPTPLPSLPNVNSPPPPYQPKTENTINNDTTTIVTILETPMTSSRAISTPPKGNKLFRLLRENQQESRETILRSIGREFEKECSKEKSCEVEEYKSSCCGECTRHCFQSVSCVSCNPFSRGRNRNQSSGATTPIDNSNLLLTNRLLKAKDEGWNDFKEAIFPLVPDFLRVLWVLIELILVLIGLIFSIATLSLDQNEAFNIIHLILAIVSCILAMIDAYETFRHSKILKKLLVSCKKCVTRSQSEEEKAVNGPSEDTTGCAKKCYSHCTDLFDVMRVILSEMIFYPLLICDIFEVITGRGFEGDSSGDRLGIALFVISLISLFFTVYIVRVVVLLGMAINATGAREQKDEDLQKKELLEEVGYDPAIKTSAVCYQGFFCAYVILQMLAQLLMYIAIAAKIRYDNRHFYQIGNTDQTIQVSSFLGYMLFAGYVVPFLGVLNFFIVTYYWSQQYQIGFHLDMVSIFRMTECAAHDIVSIKDAIKEKSEKVISSMHSRPGKVGKLIDDIFNSFVQNEFKELFEKSWLEKFIFPFKSPALVVICIIYAALQLAFVICAAQAADEMGVVFTHVLNGGGWVFYYIAAIIVGAIANCYVFLVAGFWIFVIASIIAAIIVIISCILLVFLLASCTGSSNSNNNRRFSY